MKALGENPFHALLLLTEKPAGWHPGLLAPVVAVLFTAAGLAWHFIVGVPVLGWAVTLVLAAFALADWLLLASLPRRGISFGAVQPPWLGLILLRWLGALLAVLPGVYWPIPTLAALASMQLALWLGFACGTLVAPFRVQTTHLALSNPRLANPGTPLRIVHLSDLHVERLTRRELELGDRVASLAPDLIVITGDFLSTSYNTDLQARADLGWLLSQLRAPGGVYAVWGTSEVDRPDLLRPVLEAAGVVVLEDRAVECTLHGHRLWLTGLTCSRNLERDSNWLGTLLAQAPPQAYRLVLYHTPDLMPQAASLGVDLYLCGHTHGGQWRLPLFGAILTSSRHWKRYEAGHYHETGTDLYVSRGLGMEGFGTPRARFFCPPEVVSITLSGQPGRR